MKHGNIAIFVPHIGCPCRCAFCDQHTITAQAQPTRAEDVVRICTQALAQIPDPSGTEIAFFGGSFTAIPREEMTALLKAAQPFAARCGGIRISTRPDCIDPEVLTVLRQYGVKVIELGVQSMDDAVLAANDRGHTAADVLRASRLIREAGFQLGWQIMPGLYQSTPAAEEKTMQQVLAVQPEMLRIYPVVILRGTRLAELYAAGAYVPYTMEQMLDMTAAMLLTCYRHGIPVIRCGLHASEFVERDAVGGFYHPAFRELCESRIYRREMARQLGAGQTEAVFAVCPSHLSRAAGHKRENIRFFRAQGITLRVRADADVPAYEPRLEQAPQ